MPADTPHAGHEPGLSEAAGHQHATAAFKVEARLFGVVRRDEQSYGGQSYEAAQVLFLEAIRDAIGF